MNPPPRSTVPGADPPPGDDGLDDQTLSDVDQTAADADQSSADLDQTTSESDQTASDVDQIASDRDQEAADRDQAASDHAQRADDELEGGHRAGYANSRRARSKSAHERDLTTQARSETARVREQAAVRRDRRADERDAAAQARDELATALDAELERLERDVKGGNGATPVGLEVLLRAAGDRKRAATIRAQAAAHREAAARDRERAAHDRRQAALDRSAAADELALEGIDHLTGALRRRVGMRAIQREIDRTARTDEGLVLAFVDVVGLKKTNDTKGHAAGDELLQAVALSIRQHVRSYDVVARFGGDEFVCSLSGHDASGARARFDQVSAHLADAPNRATISVGLAERRKDDTLDDLIHRADTAMIEARRT